MAVLTRHIPLTALILVNLVPILGVLHMGWDVKTLLVLYWLENVIAGIYNVIKLMSLKDDGGGRVFKSLFFTLHYGMFTLVHGMFVLSMTEDGIGEGGAGDVWSVFQVESLAGSGLTLAACGLMISHGISLIINFYGRGEYKVTTSSRQMFMPYQRMVILHITILFGGAFMEATGAPIAALCVLVALKTAMDIVAHIASHKQVAQMAQIEENPAIQGHIDKNRDNG